MTPHAGMLQRALIRLHDWLACADPVGRGDMIFALAGRQSRKICALEMFSHGWAPQLLLSVGRFEIRSFVDLRIPAQPDLLQIAAPVAPAKRHLFVWFGNGKSEAELIHKGRLGTLSEILALNTWLATHCEVRSVLVVSSAVHLRRVRLCCRRVLPPSVRVRFLAADKQEPRLRRDSWWRSAETRWIVLSELPKLLLYGLVLNLRPPGKMRVLRDSLLIQGSSREKQFILRRTGS